MINQPGFTVSLEAVLAVGMENKSGSPHRMLLSICGSMV